MLNIGLLIFIFSNTPIFVYSRVPAIASFLIFSASVFLIRGIRSHRRSLTEIILAATFFATSALSSIYNNTFMPLLYAALAIIYYHTVRAFNYDDLAKCIVWATKGIYLFAIAGALGIFVNYLFGIPFYALDAQILTPFGLLYPNEPFARASGFFLEPGQFSFYICWVVC